MARSKNKKKKKQIRRSKKKKQIRRSKGFKELQKSLDAFIALNKRSLFIKHIQNIVEYVEPFLSQYKNVKGIVIKEVPENGNVHFMLSLL